MPADDEPEPAEISRIAERHGVAPTAVTKIESGGEANHVYFLGDQLVLRIARHHPDFIADLTKEALIIPEVRALGVRTPKIVEFDDSCTITATPYLVMERFAGRRPEVPDLPSYQRWGRVYLEVGAELATLHRGLPFDAGQTRRPGATLYGQTEIRLDRREDPRDGSRLWPRPATSTPTTRAG